MKNLKKTKIEITRYSPKLDSQQANESLVEMCMMVALCSSALCWSADKGETAGLRAVIASPGLHATRGKVNTLQLLVKDARRST